MCVKFPPKELNIDSCPPHLTPTSTYTCGVTTALRVRNGNFENNFE